MDLRPFHRHNDELSVDAAITMRSPDELFVGDEDAAVLIDHNDDASLASAPGPLGNFSLSPGGGAGGAADGPAGLAVGDFGGGAAADRYRRFSESFAGLVRRGYLYAEALDRAGALDALPRRAAP